MSKGVLAVESYTHPDPPRPLATAAPALWVIALDQFDPERLAALCAEEDFARQQRLRFSHLRRRALVRWAALRHILGKRLGHPPTALVFDRDSWGKPLLRQAQSEAKLHFNTSHSKERAIIVLADAPIGVDLEHTGCERPWRDMTDLVCTAAELALLENLPQGARLRAFYRLWVAKESLVKLDGRGLSLPVNHIDARALALAPASASVWMPATGTFLHTRGFDLELDYVGSLAAAADLGAPEIKLWSPD